MLLCLQPPTTTTSERSGEREREFFLIWFNLKLYVSNVNNRKGNSRAFFLRSLLVSSCFGFSRRERPEKKRKKLRSCSVYEAEKTRNEVKLIVSLINHETFYCQRFNCFEEFLAFRQTMEFFGFRRNIYLRSTINKGRRMKWKGL